MTKTDPVQQLAEAERQKAEIEASLPALNAAVQAADTERRDTEARLEVLEGDALVGGCDKTKLEAARVKHEHAVTKARTALGHYRQAVQNLARVNEAIARLRPEAYAVEIAAFVEEHKRLVRQVLEGLEAVVAANDALHDNYRRAEARFPHVVLRNGQHRGYPVAAGLTDLSWPELRLDRYAVNGGRLGTFRQAVEQLLNPQPETAKTRATAPKPTPKPRNASDSWHPLPAEEVR